MSEITDTPEPLDLPHFRNLLLSRDPDKVLEVAWQLFYEVERLLRWKSEATEVLTAWEKVWVAAGEPGQLGASKAEATAAEVKRLSSEQR